MQKSTTYDLENIVHTSVYSDLVLLYRIFHCASALEYNAHLQQIAYFKIVFICKAHCTIRRGLGDISTKWSCAKGNVS